MVEKVLNLNREKEIFWSLLAVLLILVSLYIYFVRATIGNVVSRQNYESQSSALSIAISNKEFDYISKTDAVNLDMAYSMGFKNTQNKIFVQRDSSAKIAYLGN